MKDSSARTNGTAQSAKPNQFATISERKLKANRENAQKSTGPKTPKGKEYSRRNALKHGLFIRDSDEFVAEEDPGEFRSLYRRLRDELQPVGPSEESVVQHIAICWLRLQRLWRYENAEMESNKTTVSREVEEGFRGPLAGSQTRRTKLLLLQKAKEEAETRGQISPETLKEIFDDGYIRVMWPFHEAEAEKTAKKRRHDIAMKIAEARRIPLSEAKLLLVGEAKSLPEYAQFVGLETVTKVIEYLVQGWWNLSTWETRYEYERQLIPDDSSVDKIIRYGSAFERQLTRAYDWLERLQRRRSGGPVPPPLSVRLTQ
jgi:hypothetical protein